MNNALQNINDADLANAIALARRRLTVICPGLSIGLAKAIGAKWKDLGAHGVSVVIDLDPNVSRMGYGDFKAVELLQLTASEVGAKLQNQAGTRICVFVIDDDVYVFSPTPLVAEAKKTASDQPNGIKLTSAPSQLIEDIGNKDDAENPLSSAKDVTSIEVATAAADLKQNPPAKFDVTQKLQVFNAAFEFVEFKVSDCQIGRKTVRLEPDIVLAAKDKGTLNRVNSTFRLLDGTNNELSGERVMKLKNFIADKYLVNLPKYGNVVLRSNKEDFEKAVKTLRRYVERFQKRVEKGLQEALDGSRNSLSTALLPGVKSRPPERSIRFIGSSPDERSLETWLAADLERSFGTAKDYIRKMEVSLTFKGVTYESLRNEEFIETAKKHLYSVKELYEVFDTAKAVDR